MKDKSLSLGNLQSVGQRKKAVICAVDDNPLLSAMAGVVDESSREERSFLNAELTLNDYESIFENITFAVEDLTFFQ